MFLRGRRSRLQLCPWMLWCKSKRSSHTEMVRLRKLLKTGTGSSSGHTTRKTRQGAPLSTQTVAFSHYNHISAQLPLDPESGELVSGGVKEQAGQCLENIKAIVESIGHALDDVVKVNICLKDIADTAAVDEVYAAFFPGGVPARRTVGVHALPKEALVQIEAVVANAEGTPPRA